MPLKNYTSKGKGTFDKITKALTSHGARTINYDYDDNGRVTGIQFEIFIAGTKLPIKLPAKVDKVAMMMYGKPMMSLNEKQASQAYNTAWANIKDWIEAQMAMIDTEMVEMEEIFLPYVLTPAGETMFEMMQTSNFLLGDGKHE